jgi:protein SCO1/2
MSRTLLVILAVLAVAFAVITGLAVKRGVLRGGPQAQSASVGGPFQMTDQAGRAQTDAVLKGKWSAVFFGYTNCPDACPTTLFALAQAEKLMGPKASDFQTVFVSVDPARDTPKQLAAYLSNDAFPKRAIGLTGTDDQVAAIAHAYHVYYQKTGEGPGYTVNHSSFTYLMNPQGRFACVIPYADTPQQIAAKLSLAMQQGDSADHC